MKGSPANGVNPETQRPKAETKDQIRTKDQRPKTYQRPKTGDAGKGPGDGQAGGRMNFGGSLMKEGLSAPSTGLSKENLGGLGAWRDNQIEAESGGAANRAWPYC